MHPSHRVAGRTIGRYTLFGPIAAGGMATVHLGVLNGQAGFTRTVAIKRLHAQYAADPEFVCMFIDEGRMAARIRHANVVQTLDVAAVAGELFLIMEFIQGESLSRLFRITRTRGERIPWKIGCTIVAGVLHGIHAAHEATNQRGEPLNIIHRDISPQNVLVGIDGVARVLDFGIAKAFGRLQTTHKGQIKGTLAYMAPEQLDGEATRQSDVYSATAVLWEVLTGRRLFDGDSDNVVLAKLLEGKIARPSTLVPEISSDLDGIVMQGLDRDPGKRFQTAMEMARKLDAFAVPSSTVAQWMEGVANEALAKRKRLVLEMESDANGASPALEPGSLVATPVSDAESPDALTSVENRGALEDEPEDAPVPSTLSDSQTTRQLTKSGKRWSRTASLALGGGLLLLGIAAAMLHFVSPMSSASSVSSGVPRVEPPEPPTEAIASEVSSSPPAVPTASPGVKSTRPSASSKTARPHPPNRDCSPPYRISDEGIREYKPWCL